MVLKEHVLIDFTRPAPLVLMETCPEVVILRTVAVAGANGIVMRRDTPWEGADERLVRVEPTAKKVYAKTALATLHETILPFKYEIHRTPTGERIPKVHRFEVASGRREGTGFTLWRGGIVIAMSPKETAWIVTIRDEVLQKELIGIATKLNPEAWISTEVPLVAKHVVDITPKNAWEIIDEG